MNFDEDAKSVPPLSRASEVGLGGVAGRRELVRRALTGDRGAREQLVQVLAPVIRARTARVLRRRAGLGAELSDLIQDVFVSLFARNGHTLRCWDPERGLSLENFVGKVAERRVADALTRKSFGAVLAEPEDERADASPSPEHLAAARQEIARLIDGIRQCTDAKGWQTFVRLFFQQQSAAELRGCSGLSSAAVHQRRHRLSALAKRLRRHLERHGPARR